MSLTTQAKVNSFNEDREHWLNSSVSGFYGYDSKKLKLLIKNISENYEILFVNYKNSLLGTGGVGTVTRDMEKDLDSLQMICFDHENNSSSVDDKRIKLVNLDSHESKVFHSNYAKLYLWPVLHGLSTMHTEAEINTFRSDVMSASKKFAYKAKDVSTEGEKSPIYWINDYVLAQSVGHLRLIDPTSLIIFSWRTSFGANFPPKLYSKDRNIIFKSLLKSDLISFHTKKDIRNFVDLFREHNKDESIKFSYDKVAFIDSNDHICYLRAVPMGSNPSYRRMLSKNKYSTENRNKFRKIIGSKNNTKIITSVSRFELSKGLEYELDLIESLIQNHPELKEKFIFARFSYISDTKKKSPEYIKQYDKVLDRVKQINDKYKTHNWKPIYVDFTKKLSDSEITSLYRATDLLLVASLSDGFNHISLEGPLSKISGVDKPLQLALGKVGSAEYLTNYSSLDMSIPYDDAEKISIMLKKSPKTVESNFKILVNSCEKLSTKIWYTSILYNVIEPSIVPNIILEKKVLL